MQEPKVGIEVGSWQAPMVFSRSPEASAPLTRTLTGVSNYHALLRLFALRAKSDALVADAIDAFALEPSLVPPNPSLLDPKPLPFDSSSHDPGPFSLQVSAPVEDVTLEPASHSLSNASTSFSGASQPTSGAMETSTKLTLVATKAADLTSLWNVDPSAALNSAETSALASAAEDPRSDINAWSESWRSEYSIVLRGARTLTGALNEGQPVLNNTVDLGLLSDPSSSTSGVQSATASTNPIVLENMLPGNPQSEWGIDGGGSANIEGFATDISVDNGHTVSFKINTDSTHYRIDIYRIGYYGGDGARKVATFDKSLATAQDQPIPLFDPVTKLVDAGNWSVSATWDVPADAVSGVYFAKLTRLDGVEGANIIPFIVRDDENPSDITFQTSDTTWQAYNPWGGYNLYGSIDGGLGDSRASAVSYNRPIITREGGLAAGPQDFIFGVEYPAIRWLEQNGYNVNYISGVDTARDGAQLLNSQIFLSVGHDEYWSGDQYRQCDGGAGCWREPGILERERS